MATEWTDDLLKDPTIAKLAELYKGVRLLTDCKIYGEERMTLFKDFVGIMAGVKSAVPMPALGDFYKGCGKKLTSRCCHLLSLRRFVRRKFCNPD